MSIFIVHSRNYTISLSEGIEEARETVVETLKERKKMKWNGKRTNGNDFNVGDIVYVYRHVVTPGAHRKLLRPWIGPFFISPINVKLRREAEGKNMINVNWLKREYL